MINALLEINSLLLFVLDTYSLLISVLFNEVVKFKETKKF